MTDESDAAALDRLPEEARPTRLRQGRAYKDGGMGIVLSRDAPARTPCEAAWKIAIYQARVLDWLYLEAGPALFVLHVSMPDKELRDAVFRREERMHHGQRLVVAADTLSKTIFAARRFTECRRPAEPSRRRAS